MTGGLQWGVLSTARINDHVLPALDGRVRAVASRDADRARAYAADHGIPHSYGSYDALLADSAIDAVYISVPNDSHVEWATRALRAGKHVLVEKPFSKNAAAVEYVFDEAEIAGVHIAEAFMWRHHPQVARTRELLAAGTIGELTGVVATHTGYLGNPDDHRMDPERHGGALMDVGCYAVNAIRTFAGEPLAVTAQATAVGGVDMRMVATFSCPDGVLATMDCGLDSVYRKQVELVGTHGSLTLNDPFAGDDRPGITVLDRDRVASRYELAQPHTSYRLEVDEFEGAVLSGTAPLLGRDECVAQARVIEALYAAVGTLA